jgi:glycosyltransferase involved in cell wall biosynthesis
MIKLPLSAIVVSFNEEVRLADCLKSLLFCDEIIVCDLGSTDGSLAIAAKLATRVIRADRVPVSDVIVPSVVGEASHDWILRLDPDEVIDPELEPLIRRALAEPQPDVCGYNLPWRFYFCGKRLAVTPWGGRKYKGSLANRTRLRFQPYVHRGATALPGMHWETIEGSETATIHHFWVDSYAQLFEKHLRYIRIEGEARYHTGERFRAWTALKCLARLLLINLRPAAWWKDGLQGLFLCCFFVWYEASAALSLRAYQSRFAR